MAGIRRRLTYANVMATLAVFIALGGGAYALTRGEVKSKHIAPNAVKAKHIDFGARSTPMLATFTGLQSGTNSHNYAPSGSSGYATGLVNEALAPQTFVATGLRINLDGPLATGTREFVFRRYTGSAPNEDTALRCQISAGEQTCSSNARARIPAGASVWIRALSSGTSETDYAEVGWRAVLP
jgi:hypothetical protein